MARVHRQLSKLPAEQHIALTLAYLIAYFAQPFYHLRNSLLVHLPPGLADCVDDGEVGLEGVQRRNGVLDKVNRCFVRSEKGILRMFAPSSSSL